MTAAAMDGDREACLDAGMDDYITKPVRPDAIEAVLVRWVSQTPQERDTTPETLPVSDPLDPSQLALLRDLDDGEGAVLGEIIDEYLVQTANGRDDLVRVLDAGDLHGLARAAHGLKGASANVGANGLAEICAQLEARARFAQLEGVRDLIDCFDAEFARVRDALASTMAAG